MSIRDQILSADDRKSITFHVPEWNLDVRLSVMSGLERDAFEHTWLTKQSNGKLDLRGFRGFIVCKHLQDSNGDRVFRDDDIDLVNDMSGAVICRIADKWLALNGITEKDQDDLTSGLGAKELAKN